MSDLLIAPALRGDRRALARLMSQVEAGDATARAIIAAIYPHTGRAHIIGVTGAPGAGKSSLVNALAAGYRRRGQSVGIIAVDPTSPFSGGAILGDRVRMSALAGDAGVFIRSIATRGSLGGLAAAAGDMVKLLDAAGFQRIFIETVGAGQTEVDIAQAAHTVLVVAVPGLGDDIQAIKAGILEIADIFVVNKADRDGADAVALTLELLLQMGSAASQTLLQHGALLDPPTPVDAPAWRPPICKTVALNHEGAPALLDAIERHAVYLRQSGQWAARERRRAAGELETIVRQELWRGVLARAPRQQMAGLIDEIVSRQTDPYAAAGRLLAAPADQA